MPQQRDASDIGPHGSHDIVEAKVKESLCHIQREVDQRRQSAVGRIFVCLQCILGRSGNDGVSKHVHPQAGCVGKEGRRVAIKKARD
jgi:hypothetical protein